MSEKRGMPVRYHVLGFLAVLLVVQGVQIWAGWWQPSRFATGSAWLGLAMLIGADVIERWLKHR